MGMRKPKLNQPSMAANEKFASVLSIVSENGLLALSDIASSASTCKDTQAAVGSLMHEYPVPFNGASGPQRCLIGLCWRRCSICHDRYTNMQWPIPPHDGLTICNFCFFKKLNKLGYIPTMEARQKYRVKDLSGLQWIPDPWPTLHRTRYYKESDVRVLAVREQGGPKRFQKAQEAWQTRDIMRRKKNSVNQSNLTWPS